MLIRPTTKGYPDMPVYKSPWNFERFTENKKAVAASVEAQTRIANSPQFSEMIRRRVEEIQSRYK